MKVLNSKSLGIFALEAKSTLIKFPFVILTSICATILSIYLIESNWTDKNQLRLLSVLILGIPILIGAKLLSLKPILGKEINLHLSTLVGILLLALFYFATRENVAPNYFLLYFQVSFMAHLLLSFVLFLRNGEISGFWQFNKTLFIRCVLTTIYSAFLYIGMALILISIEYLFDFNIPKTLYIDLFIFCAFVFQTWHFLAGIPGDLTKVNESTDYPIGLKIFTQYLLIPLLTLYMLVLYAYLFKIILQWNLPKGLVSWMISTMSVLGIFNLLLLYPKSRDKEDHWIASYSKYFYIALLPLITLLLVAVGKRISDYGVTESRYFLVAIACCLFCNSLYFIASTKKDIRFIPISLFIFAFLSSFGPWGAYKFSLRSQERRLEKILMKNNILEHGKINVNHGELPLAEEKDISSIVEYIVKNHGDSSFKQWLSSIAPLAKTNGLHVSDLVRALGIKYTPPNINSQNTSFSYSTLLNLEPIEIETYSHVLEFGTDSYKQFSFHKKNYQLYIDNDRSVVEIRRDRDVFATFNLAAAREKIESSRLEHKTGNLPLEFMTLKSESSKFQAKLILRNFLGTSRDHKIKIENLSGLLFFKSIEESHR